MAEVKVTCAFGVTGTLFIHNNVRSLIHNYTFMPTDDKKLDTNIDMLFFYGKFLIIMTQHQ